MDSGLQSYLSPASLSTAVKNPHIKYVLCLILCGRSGVTTHCKGHDCNHPSNVFPTLHYVTAPVTFRGLFSEATVPFGPNTFFLAAKRGAQGEKGSPGCQECRYDEVNDKDTRSEDSLSKHLCACQLLHTCQLFHKLGCNTIAVSATRGCKLDVTVGAPTGGLGSLWVELACGFVHLFKQAETRRWPCASPTVVLRCGDSLRCENVFVRATEEGGRHGIWKGLWPAGIILDNLSMGEYVFSSRFCQPIQPNESHAVVLPTWAIS